MQFIRVYNSDGGWSDLTLGTAMKILRSNGSDAPSFEMSAGERLRHMFSYTQKWEAAEVTRVSGVDYGMANFTAEFERSLLTGDRFGPGVYTTPSDHPFTQRV